MSHVGQQIRARRVMAGLSQTALGDALGVSFQQIQKYEKGSNRVGSSNLYAIAQALDVPIAAFFDGLDDAAPTVGAPRDGRGPDMDLLKMSRDFVGLAPGQRAAVRNLVRSMAAVAARAEPSRMAVSTHRG